MKLSCPKCGSDNIAIARSPNGPVWCLDCHFKSEGPNCRKHWYEDSDLRLLIKYIQNCEEEASALSRFGNVFDSLTHWGRFEAYSHIRQHIEDSIE